MPRRPRIDGDMHGHNSGNMNVVEQLALFLENKPSALSRVLAALAEEKINIYALSVSDTVDHAVVRMVVSDPRRALHLFEAHGAMVVENEVLMIENDNKPGSLVHIASVLGEHKINIEYAYLASMPSSRRGLLVLRVNDVKKAQRVLKEVLEKGRQ